ncbi:MAG: hypothetical protein KAY32_08390 [Candidatus Eisenbacteria sp.]|nr:hypothetical protein [Candidatus Eisenbacteria bacterium]
MRETITWVALDASKKRYAVVVLEPEPREFMAINEARALRRLGRKLVREAPGEARIRYDAGPCCARATCAQPQSRGSHSRRPEDSIHTRSRNVMRNR